jgi:hypothetical protein
VGEAAAGAPQPLSSGTAAEGKRISSWGCNGGRKPELGGLYMRVWTLANANHKEMLIPVRKTCVQLSFFLSKMALCLRTLALTKLAIT